MTRDDGALQLPPSDNGGAGRATGAVDRSLLSFVAKLRRAGVSVSTGAVLDAAAALAAIEWVGGGQLRGALEATLIKRAEDRPRFTAVWEAGASPLEATDVAARDEEPPLIVALREQGWQPDAIEQLLAHLATASARLSPFAGAVLGVAQTGLSELLGLAGFEARLDQLRSPQHVGRFVARLQELLGVRQAEVTLEGLAEQLDAQRAPSRPAAEALRHALRRALAIARQRIRSVATAQAAQVEASYPALAATPSSEAFASAAPWANLDSAAELDLAVNGLAGWLGGRRARRTLRSSRGRLDLSATARSSLATDGVPLRLRYRARRSPPPKLLVLCDVSDSMRASVGLLLRFVHGVQRRFPQTRSLVFVSQLGDATELFAEQTLDRALSAVLSGAVVDIGAQSNYVRAFATLVDRFDNLLTRETTVLVVGDGRTGGRELVAEQVEALARRAKRLVWWSPEPPIRWGTGDSALLQLEPLCHRVDVVMDLASLRSAAERLASER